MSNTTLRSPADGAVAPDGLTRRRVVAAAAAGAALAAVASAPATAARRPASPSGLPSAAAVAAKGADPADLGLAEAVALLQARRLSSVELTDACLARIAERDGDVRAFVRVYADAARAQARAADRRLGGRAVRRLGAAPALCGIPIALKDLFAVRGRGLEAGSALLRGNVATGDSTVWSRLQDAGAVLLGHTHLTEFAVGDRPPTRNPWNLARSPGASSAGNGALLAARMAPAAIGTDTGGSVRTPAAWCGVTALKPTYGRISTHGVIPLAWGWDHVGPMARSAADCALLLTALAGPSADDRATQALAPLPSLSLATRRGPKPLRGLRIGVVRRADLDGLAPGVAARFDRAVGELRSFGARAVSVAIPPTDPQITRAYQAEWLGYHAQFFPARAAEYGERTRATLASASSARITGDEYLDGQRARVRFAADWRAVLVRHRLDAVVLPTMVYDGREFAAGAPPGTRDVTRAANDSGLPALSIPVGRSDVSGLPVGVQLYGLPGSEAGLLQLAVDYQARTPYHAEAPVYPFVNA